MLGIAKMERHFVGFGICHDLSMLVWVHLGVKKKMDQFAIVMHMEGQFGVRVIEKVVFVAKG
jgi:hypothetical protein